MKRPLPTLGHPALAALEKRNNNFCYDNVGAEEWVWAWKNGHGRGKIRVGPKDWQQSTAFKIKKIEEIS